MCGIVFFGGNLSSPDMKKFEELLYLDTFRGPDSTGVAVIGSNGKHPQIYKEAITGPEYLGTKTWKAMSTAAVKDKASCLIGHNRWATMGAVNGTNAHPFRVGDITLVHNGTLENQSLLPDSDRFVVDSENIAHSINKIGLAETIKKLDGAFTLVYHDNSDQTVHIIRNSKRPFHLAETSGGDWFGASEEGMLKCILERGKYNPKVKRYFELTVGTEMIFDARGKLKLLSEVQHTLPTFPSKYYGYGNTSGSSYGSYGGYSYGKAGTAYQNTSSRSNGRAAKLLKASKDTLVKYNTGYTVGEEIQFMAGDFYPFSGNPSLGNVVGWTMDFPKNVEIKWYAAPVSEFTYGDMLVGKILSAREENGLCTVVIGTNSVTRLEDKKFLAYDIGEKVTILESSDESFWNINRGNDVGRSGEIEEVVDFLGGIGYMVKGSMFAWPDSCLASIEEETKLINGQYLRQSEWEVSHVQNCGFCDHPIDWEHAEACEFCNGVPMCTECESTFAEDLALSH